MNTEMQLFSISRKKKPEYEHGVAHKVYENKLNQYGFVIEKEMLEIIEQCRKDKDEIGKIALLSELNRRREKIDEINEALLRYF